MTRGKSREKAMNPAMARGGSNEIRVLVTVGAPLPQKSEEPSGGNGASFRERESGSSLSPRHCPLFLAIQIRGLRIMDPLLMSGVSGLSIVW